MKCPECHTEVNDNKAYCPNCGSPLPHSRHDDTGNEPTISRGLVVFIIIGTIFLVVFGVYYYSVHKNDPEYTQTAIEPDSNLADKNAIKIDTLIQGTLEKDSMDKQEESQAEKVFNSIRGRHNNRHSATHDSRDEAEESALNGNSEDATQSESSASTPPSAPKPHIESIESE